MPTFYIPESGNDPIWQKIKNLIKSFHTNLKKFKSGFASNGQSTVDCAADIYLIHNTIKQTTYYNAYLKEIEDDENFIGKNRWISMVRFHMDFDKDKIGNDANLATTARIMAGAIQWLDLNFNPSDDIDHATVVHELTRDGRNLTYLHQEMVNDRNKRSNKKKKDRDAERAQAIADEEAKQNDALLAKAKAAGFTDIETYTNHLHSVKEQEQRDLEQKRLTKIAEILASRGTPSKKISEAYTLFVTDSQGQIVVLNPDDMKKLLNSYN